VGPGENRNKGVAGGVLQVSIMFKPLPLAAVLCAATLSTACGAHYIRSAPPVANVRPTPDDSVSRHVVIVSVDGLRPDAIETFGAPTLQRLMREGSYTMSARTIDPSKTLPSHTSMLTGQPPERHNVLWNNVVSADANTIDVPNVFGVARANGYKTAAFFSKAKFQPLQVSGTLDYSQAPGGWFGRWNSERTVGDAIRYLEASKPNLLFVHLSDPDAAGHANGWMTPAYGRAVLTADAAINRLLGAFETTFGRDGFSIIVTADHGGHDTNHGSDDPRDVTIPWIVWGKGVKPGRLDDATVRTMDTAATSLWLLGVDRPADWAGTAVMGAFTAAATSQAGGGN
jgi:arylsulfatase A-like enzyme